MRAKSTFHSLRVFGAIFGLVGLSLSIALAESQPSASEELVELGTLLFFDNQLSGDASLSCASCHDPEEGWGDGQPLSRAYPGGGYFRNAPTLLNTGMSTPLYWDGRVSDLDEAVRDALESPHFLNVDQDLLVARLEQIPGYVERFERVLGGSPSYEGVVSALVAFLDTLRSTNVPLDQGRVSKEVRRGYRIFRGRAGCIQCHVGPSWSDGLAHDLGVPENPDIRTDPLRQVTLRAFYRLSEIPSPEETTTDPGYRVVSGDAADHGRFVTPTLREVVRTGPYMHNGSLATLQDVLDFYDRGGGEGADPLLRPLGLSESDKHALLAFLYSLSGDEVIVDRPEIPRMAPLAGED